VAARRKKKSSISWLHDIKQDWTNLKKWNAKRKTANVKMAKERRKANADIARAKLESDALRAERRRAAAVKKAEHAAQVRARRAAAEARAQQTAAKPQVVKARVVPAPKPAVKKTAARPEFTARARAIDPGKTQPSSVLCGARTDDGTPCQNPTLGDTCAAGHHPKGKPTAKKPAPPAQQRTHDGLGRPLTPESREFFRLREEEGYKGPIQWDKNRMPFKVDENGKRRA